MERTYEAPSNEAPHMILGYHQGRLVTYLQFGVFFFRNSMGPSSEPHPQCYTICCTVVAIWNQCWSFTICSAASDLICMFQDSVPAGSYNHPFLSSVCVCICTCICICICIFICICTCIFKCSICTRICAVCLSARINTCLHACAFAFSYLLVIHLTLVHIHNLSISVCVCVCEMLIAILQQKELLFTFFLNACFLSHGITCRVVCHFIASH